jgi:long-chain acyl-CoA synthetase
MTVGMRASKQRDTIVDRIANNARLIPEKPAIRHRHGDGWRTITWREYAARAKAFAGALLSMGYEPGWGVGIMASNSAEWLIADVGAMMARAVPAGIYQTSTPEQAAYVAHHCEARVVVVEDREQWTKIKALRDQLTNLQRVVMIREAETVDDELVTSFEAFCESGSSDPAATDARFDEIEPGELATLIYTSGTTGPPKGVMLSHTNLAATAANALKVVGKLDPDDCMVSYLPLSHIAEQMFSIHLSATAGYPIWIAERIELLKETLLAARPTVFMGVPRVWEKFRRALALKLDAATGPKSWIINWSRTVGADVGPTVVERGAPEGLDGFRYRIAGRLFYSKLAGQLGLDRLRIAVSGAAPIGKDVLEFFLTCGIVIHEVYGQSEGSGPTSFNRPMPGKRRLGTVGVPFPGTEVKLAEDGEILVRGPNVFLGYFKEPAATAETLIDGWLHSGDVGEFDEDGFLRITDRKKDLIVTAGGKNVAPQAIEKLLRRDPSIAQAVVIGDRRKFLCALLTLDAEGAAGLSETHGWPAEPEALVAHPGFRSHVQKAVDEANAGLARYEQIKRFDVLPLDFSVEGGELTPTQKVRRKIVNDKYAERIEKLYADVS